MIRCFSCNAELPGVVPSCQVCAERVALTMRSTKRIIAENAALLEKNVMLAAIVEAYRALRGVERELLQARAHWDRVYYREEEPLVRQEATEAVRFLQERKQEIEAQLKKLEAT